MTIADVARLEQISERSAQRYCREGFQGHVLPAVKAGRSFSIAESDYRQWRRDCGFDETPAEPAALPPAPPDGAPASSFSEAHPVPGAPGEAPCAEYPPYPKPADPHGVLTNCPNEHSCNWPHPLAVADHMRHEAQKLVEKYRGDSNAVPED